MRQSQNRHDCLGELLSSIKPSKLRNVSSKKKVEHKRVKKLKTMTKNDAYLKKVILKQSDIKSG